MHDVQAAIERAKAEIIVDIRAGTVPADVASFSELHDHVDANEYGGLCGEAWGHLSEDCRDENAVQNAVDLWIRDPNGLRAALGA